MLIKLYNSWKRAKGVFVRPRLHIYFGKWRSDPSLPMWRRGPLIYLFRRKNLYKYTYYLKDSVMIYTGTKTFKLGDKEYESKCYNWAARHKLPGKLKRDTLMWKSDIRKKLKKWHLSWLPPVINLPLWMQFHIVNLDVMWKTKFDEIRYEYPPQFSIIAFGLSLTFTLHCPTKDKYANDDHYWESLLNYIFDKEPSIGKAVETAGVWSILNDDGTRTDYAALRPEFLEPYWHFEYRHAIRTLEAQTKHKIL